MTQKIPYRYETVEHFMGCQEHVARENALYDAKEFFTKYGASYISCHPGFGSCIIYAGVEPEMLILCDWFLKTHKIPTFTNDKFREMDTEFTDACNKGG